MNDSVLTVGERIVLAARLAAIEHVRQELEAQAAKAEASKRAAATVVDRSTAFMDESDAPALSRPVTTLLAEYFRSIEKRGKTARRPQRAEAA